jgi:hypothetical protein
MLSPWKSGQVFVLSAVMFSAGVGVATVALSSLPSVTATPGIVAQSVKQSKAEQVIEEDGLKWELLNCSRAGQKVICNFIVTNVGQQDRYVVLAGNSSRIFDLSGNEYTAKGNQIGKEQSSSTASTTLIRGIPTKASVSFELPQEITSFAVLEVSYFGGKIQFRNINVSGVQASNPASSVKCPPQKTPKKTAIPRPR